MVSTGRASPLTVLLLPPSLAQYGRGYVSPLRRAASPDALEIHVSCDVIADIDSFLSSLLRVATAADMGKRARRS